MNFGVRGPRNRQLVPSRRLFLIVRKILRYFSDTDILTLSETRERGCTTDGERDKGVKIINVCDKEENAKEERKRAIGSLVLD